MDITRITNKVKLIRRTVCVLFGSRKRHQPKVGVSIESREHSPPNLSKLTIRSYFSHIAQAPYERIYATYKLYGSTVSIDLTVWDIRNGLDENFVQEDSGNYISVIFKYHNFIYIFLVCYLILAFIPCIVYLV